MHDCQINIAIILQKLHPKFYMLFGFMIEIVRVISTTMILTNTTIQILSFVNL